MQTILNVIGMSFVSIIIIYIISMVFHVIFLVFNVWEKMEINIYLPKPKKYIIKVNPIYDIEEADMDDSLFVRKWELSYNELKWLRGFLIMIPWPITIHVFRYNVVDSYYLCSRDNIKLIEGELKDIFEEKYNKNKEEYGIFLSKEKDEKNKINELNKIFNENYE
jgi:hypothetical protein